MARTATMEFLRLRSVILALSVVVASRNRNYCHGFSTRSSSSSTRITRTTRRNSHDNNVLILDHININHEKGRHDWLKSFYGEEFLGCAWDPRKAKNIETGRKTLWANIGAHQFHLSEGSPDAQVLDGLVTVVHPSLETLKERYQAITSDPDAALNDSKFNVVEVENDDDGEEALDVTDPWGSVFRIVNEQKTIPGERDSRGSQPGDTSEGLAIRDLTVYVPIDANLDGIGRFYRDVLGGELVVDESRDDENRAVVQIRMGPLQTLTFVPKESIEVNTHVDLREVQDADAKSQGTSTTLGNYGVHISLYVADLPSCYQRASDLGLTYVNTRFSRRAYNLEEAVNDCMFRCLDIVDPENVQDGPILRLEHEVRSVLKRDGTKYKSCPFEEIPENCVTL
ncbi:unnamed protein product [Pseudo-nitzschia multistriata]|uniref:VOC domain-containing protein n=1 Tax=Pseudo-nitzschia multistriata TaxID=183589 RepID=A0A448YZ71_9STRA|nr:unnamed protein product [Pseudo-nitzschia multistriata]